MAVRLKFSRDANELYLIEIIYRSLIDLNRAGVGLMELVFEPDLRDGEEAVACIAELIRILEALGTCDCKMEGKEEDFYLLCA